MHYKKCEICGVRSGKQKDSTDKRLFLAQYPVEPNRCKQWVKLTGKEDLAYVPIEKLHTLKYICGKHFDRTDFNKKGTRLRNTAVPSKHLKHKPLNDELLENFPLPIAIDLEICMETLKELPNKICFKSCHTDKPECSIFTDHNYFKQNKTVLKDTGKYPGAHYVEIDSTEPVDGNSSPHIEQKPVTYSWEQAQEVCLDDPEEDLYVDNNTAPETECDDDQQVPLLRGYVCNVCKAIITKFVYKCIECFDYDLCADCERAGKHCTHFLLRVPERKATDEIRAVLDKLRLELFSEMKIEEIKTEIKEECDPIEAPEELVSNHTLMANEMNDKNTMDRRVDRVFARELGEQTNLEINDDEECYDVDYLESDNESLTSISMVNGYESIHDSRIESCSENVSNEDVHTRPIGRRPAESYIKTKRKKPSEETTEEICIITPNKRQLRVTLQPLDKKLVFNKNKSKR